MPKRVAVGTMVVMSVRAARSHASVSPLDWLVHGRFLSGVSFPRRYATDQSVECAACEPGRVVKVRSRTERRNPLDGRESSGGEGQVADLLTVWCQWIPARRPSRRGVLGDVRLRFSALHEVDGLAGLLQWGERNVGCPLATDVGSEVGDGETDLPAPEVTGHKPLLNP